MNDESIEYEDGSDGAEMQQRQQEEEEQEAVRDITLRPGQDYVDGDGMYYVVNCQGGSYVIGQKQTTIPVEECAQAGIRLRSDKTLERGLSQDYLTCIANGTVAVNPSETFCTLKEHLKSHIFLRDPRMYDLVATWIIATYHFRIFSYFPYLNLHGEKNSGKSMLLRVLDGLVFNGILTDDSTSISMASDSSTYGATILYDEAEKFNGAKPMPIGNVLNSGFEHTGQIRRKDRAYSTYSPKVLSAINSLENVLADRTIPIRMVRKLPDERVARFLQTPETVASQQKLREGMYSIGIQFGTAIAAEYCYDLPSIGDKAGHLQNRVRDLWSPLLSVAATLGVDGLVNSLLTVSKELSDEKIAEDASSNESGVLITALQSVIQTLTPARHVKGVSYYYPSQVQAVLAKHEVVAPDATQAAVTRLLHNKVGIMTKGVKIGKRTSRLYGVPDGHIEEYAKRYIPDTVTPY